AAAQSPSTGFPNVINALKAAPGCLGVETGQTSSGRQVIFAWFEDKKALVDWYHSDVHQRAMKSVFPNTTFDRQPLPELPEDTGTILAIVSVLHHAARCGGRLDKHCRHVIQRCGNRVQVHRRKRQVFREGAVTVANAKNGAHVAVSTPCRATPRTASAPDSDLAHDAPCDPCRVAGSRIFNDSDELVAGHA